MNFVTNEPVDGEDDDNDNDYDDEIIKTWNTMFASIELCTHTTNILVTFLHRYIICKNNLDGALCASYHDDGTSFVCLSPSCASISNNHIVDQTSTMSKTTITKDKEDNNLT